MAYLVRIEIRKGKLKTVTSSTPLRTKEDVVRWVRRNPVGNSNTKVKVTNTITKKSIIGSKMGFSILHNINW